MRPRVYLTHNYSKQDATTSGTGLVPDSVAGEEPIMYFANTRPIGPGPRKPSATVKMGSVA